MDNYEIRRSQTEMIHACSGIIENGGTLMVEAGTGTGKTFAYLIPLILSEKKALISTRTINLQEQLFRKDLNFLAGFNNFSFAIAKGRGNYLCLRRLNAYSTADQQELSERKRLIAWAVDTTTGDVEDLGNYRSFLWEKVCSDPDACKGLYCPYYKQCFYFSARKAWDSARIVVVNHSLMGINSMLPDTSKILPDAEVLVIDEAHALDHALSEVIGSTFSNRGFEKILNSLLRMDERGHYRGLLCTSPALFSPTLSLRSEMGHLWEEITIHCKDRETIKDSFIFADTITRLSESIRMMISEIRSSPQGLFSEDDEIELSASVLKLQGFAEGLEEFAHGTSGFVRWVEIERDKIALRTSPVYPRDFILNSIIPSYQSVIMTSATLSVSGNFHFISHLLGLRDAEKISLPSPFDLSKQVMIDIRKGIDVKSEDGASKLAQVIIEEASRKDGGILVLFTSREVMQKTWELCSDELTRMGTNPMIQGELSNRMMLDIMRESNNSVIFGLDSFWEGVDVKGDALKCLVITKLPFEVPTEPVTMARAEEIEQEGGNPFYGYALPRAVLKFKQGFGRLIRSKTDTGRVVICDERIETKQYGQLFKNILHV